MNIATCDFETTTDVNDCRVWAAGFCDIDTLEFNYGNTIDYFFEFAVNYNKIYFHNLKFDGEFLLAELFRRGYKHTKNRKVNAGEFSTLISDMGQYYNICINIDGKLVNIYDSLKLLPFTVDKIAKMFNLPILKGEIDYNEYRPVGHVLTQNEVDYLKNDCEIMARALMIQFKQNLKKITIGSNALSDYKNIIGKKKFERNFPVLEYDEKLRKSYKGGFTYLNPVHAGVEIGKGIVLDVNSLYPAMMYFKNLPYGEGQYFTGEYKENKIYNTYIQKFECEFELKENKIPTIQLKGNYSYKPTEYITKSYGIVELTLTNVDLKLFLENYNVYNLHFYEGYKFKSNSNMFKSYIDKWMNVKIKAEQEGNGAMRTLAKLMLNNLYGKFSTNPVKRCKIPYYDNRVRYRVDEPELTDGLYLPVGAFITSYARETTIRSAMKVYDRFIYSDTDSLHLIGEEIPDSLKIDKYNLGEWKHESTFTRAKFLRAKTYIEEIDGELKITCAGMPKRCHEQVTFNNFNIGAEYTGKLIPKHVDGGIVLDETTFIIKG